MESRVVVSNEQELNVREGKKCKNMHESKARFHLFLFMQFIGFIKVVKTSFDRIGVRRCAFFPETAGFASSFERTDPFRGSGNQAEEIIEFERARLGLVHTAVEMGKTVLCFSGPVLHCML